MGQKAATPRASSTLSLKTPSWLTHLLSSTQGWILLFDLTEAQQADRSPGRNSHLLLGLRCIVLAGGPVRSIPGQRGRFSRTPPFPFPRQTQKFCSIWFRGQLCVESVRDRCARKRHCPGEAGKKPPRRAARGVTGARRIRKPKLAVRRRGLQEVKWGGEQAIGKEVRCA